MKHVTKVPWSDEERAQLRRLHENGLSHRQICAMMGRSKHSVHRQRINLGLTHGDRNPAVKREKGEAPYRPGVRTTLPPLPSLRDDNPG